MTTNTRQTRYDRTTGQPMVVSKRMPIHRALKMVVRLNSLCRIKDARIVLQRADRTACVQWTASAEAGQRKIHSEYEAKASQRAAQQIGDYLVTEVAHLRLYRVIRTDTGHAYDVDLIDGRCDCLDDMFRVNRERRHGHGNAHCKHYALVLQAIKNDRRPA